MANPAFNDFVAKHGAWTAMSIMLSDGTYTRTPPGKDQRLRRLVQTAQDTINKPLSDCRVLDLACLEGHYAIEFAMQGAEAIGIEGRAVSVEKCNFVKNDLALSRATFFQDDVLNLSCEKYGRFDIVICSGILYHLQAEDAVRFLESISEVCDGILLIDTFIALSSQTTEDVAGTTLHGHHYFEHSERDDDTTKHSRLWASLNNTTSFWMTEPTLLNLLSRFGFTSVMDVLVPAVPASAIDRKTYLAIKGPLVTIKSSSITQNETPPTTSEEKNLNFDASQKPKSRVFLIAKAVLPQPVIDAIKPILRSLKFLPPDTTPEFMKKERKAQ
jgi:2-polyprenyl-3-methyl-5-hydroxy-6-metoxy-1,4-benzoquinol methylase